MYQRYISWNVHVFLTYPTVQVFQDLFNLIATLTFSHEIVQRAKGTEQTRMDNGQTSKPISSSQSVIIFRIRNLRLQRLILAFDIMQIYSSTMGLEVFSRRKCQHEQPPHWKKKSYGQRMSRCNETAMK